MIFSQDLKPVRTLDASQLQDKLDQINKFLQESDHVLVRPLSTSTLQQLIL